MTAEEGVGRGSAPKLTTVSVPSLPTGGGAIRGIGEKFSVGAATGTRGLTIPLPITAARGGFQPELTLAYESGLGNGLFGIGWQVALPRIQRKTDRQLPTYLDGEDIFVMSGIEDLVPVSSADGVTRYQPRVEAGFARIEQMTAGWRTTTADNVRNTYGTTIASGERTFAWLLDRREDALGNVIAFDYVAEDLRGVAPTPAEIHRIDGTAPFANRYIKAVRYGNTTPGDDSTWRFAVVFDYGDHDDSFAATRAWPVRPDPFSTYRAGFDIRTYRRCARVMQFHRFAELGPAETLVRSLAFTYDDDTALSHLVAIEARGHGATETLATPPMRLAYTPVALQTDVVATVAVDSIGDLPGGVDGAQHQWVDLDAEGIPGVLSDGCYYRRNLGGGALAAARILSTHASAGGTQLVDLDGDGRLELASFGPPLPGFYARVPDGPAPGDWEPFQPFESRPQVDFADPNVRFIDLDGDGLEDILIARDDSFVWYPSLGRAGFGPPRLLPRPGDEELGPAIVFADATHSIALADLSGDGLRDLVRIENGRICYWPNLGQGRFGAKVTMIASPVFDLPDQFEARRVLFADIDGTGTSDLIYVGRDGVSFWLNQAGNGWDAGHHVANLPPDTPVASVTVADLLGTGTACLVWSSADAPVALRYVDLLGGMKPHLLAEVDNQLGLVTRTRYAPSTKFYLADREAGITWATHLGFPVQVVERVETYDAVRAVRFVSEYSYRDGYYDGYEREYRGFGYVEQRDTESDPTALGAGLFADRPPPMNGAYSQPPIVTRTWTHTGVWLAPGGVVPADLTPAESRDAYRALRGSVLRQEILCDDGSPLASLPYTVTTHSYQVRRVVPAQGNRHGVFLAFSRGTIEAHSERTDDPRIAETMVIDVDEYGHVRSSAAIGFGRATGDAEQTTTLASYTEVDLANVADQADWYRLAVPLETRTYELAVPPGPLTMDQVVSAARRLVGRTRTRYYDSEALPQPLAYGTIDRRALVYDTQALALTAELLDSLYQGRVTTQLLLDGRYTADADGWWLPSGRALPDPARFFLATQYVDPFGAMTTAGYDSYDLLVETVTDARQNVTSAAHDYRWLVPSVLTDANGNRSAIELDALGRVIALRMMGPVNSALGDPAGLPTSQFDYTFYDPTSGRPSVSHAMARETHGDPTTAWQHTYSYSDGTGREVMKKMQAEPGLALQRQVDGTYVQVATDPRWIGTGRTVFDNKGNPIEQYEPYFSATSDYETDDVLTQWGFASLMHYDPLGRLIETEYPDGSRARVTFTPWDQTTFDRNDTVLEIGNAWYARMLGSADPAERRAAQLAKAHAGTPSVTRHDVLGRAYLAIADNGGGNLLPTRTRLDILGNALGVRDPLDRVCITRAFDLVGRPCHTTSIDGGDRWTIANAAGHPLRSWDARGQTVWRVYDVLQRAIEIHVADPSGERIVETTLWGEDYPGEGTGLNLRTRPYQRRDGAGVATNAAFDFKGNLLASTRQLAIDYSHTPNWAQPTPLEQEVFASATMYDALDRPTQLTAPDGSIVTLTYKRAALLDGVTARVRGAASPTPFVTGIEYDEKGQRTRIAYGSASTNYRYEPQTLRLAALVTTRTDGSVLQDLAYTYDAAGNIVQTGDAAQRAVYFKNAVADGTALYTYEPIYRLSTVQAREHAALSGPRTDVDGPIANLPDDSDGQALVPYTESYEYDDNGNVLTITHGTVWTSPMAYVPGTNRLRATMSAGDDPVAPDQWHGLYTYDPHGNTTTMPHLPLIEWDWKDQMQHADRLGGGDVYFTYDAGGERVRKVWEHGGTIEERIYFGSYEVYRVRTGTTPTLERQTLHILDGARRIAMVETKTLDRNVASLVPIPVVRFQLGNHLGSAAVEIDESGRLISYEEYHPFGTSAYRAANASIEVSQKRYRYTGKERDEETSLEYHHARYYAPWLARWTAVDAKGIVDGPNPYLYVNDAPLTQVDARGHDAATTSLFDTMAYNFKGLGIPTNFMRDLRKRFDVDTTSDLESSTSELRDTIHLSETALSSLKRNAYNARWTGNGATLASDAPSLSSIFHEATHAWLFTKENDPAVHKFIEDAKKYYAGVTSISGRTISGQSDLRRLVHEASAEYVQMRVHAYLEARGALEANARKGRLTPAVLAKIEKQYNEKMAAHDWNGYWQERGEQRITRPISPQMKEFLDKNVLENKFKEKFSDVAEFAPFAAIAAKTPPPPPLPPAPPKPP